MKLLTGPAKVVLKRSRDAHTMPPEVWVQLLTFGIYGSIYVARGTAKHMLLETQPSWRPGLTSSQGINQAVHVSTEDKAYIVKNTFEPSPAQAQQWHVPQTSCKRLPAPTSPASLPLRTSCPPTPPTLDSQCASTSCACTLTWLGNISMCQSHEVIKLFGACSLRLS